MSNCRKHTATFFRTAYVMTGVICLISIFYTTISFLFSSDEHKQEKSYHIEDHLFVILIALLAGVIQACEDNYLQGPKIAKRIANIKVLNENNSSDSESESDEDSNSNDKIETTRTWKSNFAELSYILLTIIKIIAERLFTGSAVKAWIKALQGATPILALEPLDGFEIVMVVLYSLLFAVPFNLTTAGSEVCEEIKKKMTGSSSNSLLHSCLKPFANRVGISYIKFTGFPSHVIEHMIDLVLFIPPELILELKKHKELFAASITVSATVGLTLMSFNALQTYLFEMKISEGKLKRIAHGGENHPLFGIPFEESEEILLSPAQYKIVKYGLKLFTPIIHGVDVALPPTLVLRHQLNKHNARNLKLPLVILFALILAVFNGIGTYFSEILDAEGQLKIKNNNDDEEKGQKLRFIRK